MSGEAGQNSDRVGSVGRNFTFYRVWGGNNVYIQLLGCEVWKDCRKMYFNN